MAIELGRIPASKLFRNRGFSTYGDYPLHGNGKEYTTPISENYGYLRNILGQWYRKTHLLLVDEIWINACYIIAFFCFSQKQWEKYVFIMVYLNNEIKVQKNSSHNPIGIL